MAMKKTGSLRIRLDMDKYANTVEYLKLLPGGITGFVEKALDSVKVNEELLDVVRRLKLQQKQ